jgi:hypothetical protein
MNPLLFAALAALIIPLVAAAETTIYAVGDIADCRLGAAKSAAAATTRLVPDDATLLVLGDAVYPTGSPYAFTTCFAPTWGRHLDHTYAVPGNHEYYAEQGQGFYQYFGAHAGSRGYLSTVLGDWLIVGLNSNLDAAGMDEQFRWFDGLLRRQAASSPCLLAFWHHPLFSSGRHGKGAEAMKRFWQRLEQEKADLVLNGHEHFYEAFAPQNLAAVPGPGGIREFVVGTGGGDLDDHRELAANSQVVIKEFGVLELTLGERRYAWRFIGGDGRVGDRGSAGCHR